MSINPLAQVIGSAITRQENVSSVDPTANNPGALMDIPYYKSTGEFRLARYSTIEDGVLAMEQTISSYINQGYSLESMFQKYAPSGHGSNNPAIYASHVSDWTGIPKDVPMNKIDPNQIQSTQITQVQTNPITIVNPGNLEQVNTSETDTNVEDPTNGLASGLGTIAVVGVGLFLLKFIFRS